MKSRAGEKKFSKMEIGHNYEKIAGNIQNEEQSR